MALEIGLAPKPMSRLAQNSRTHPPDTFSGARTVPPTTSGPRQRYLYVVIGFIAVVVVVTTSTIRNEYRKQLTYWQEKLTRIADANQRGLEYWVKERAQDAELMASFRCTQMAALSQPAWPLRRPTICSELANVADTYSYAGAYVLDREGTIQVSLDGSPALPPEVVKTAGGDHSVRS
jgi:hypothetical protein